MAKVPDGALAVTAQLEGVHAGPLGFPELDQALSLVGGRAGSGPRGGRIRFRPGRPLAPSSAAARARLRPTPSGIGFERVDVWASPPSQRTSTPSTLGSDPSPKCSVRCSATDRTPRPPTGEGSHLQPHGDCGAGAFGNWLAARTLAAQIDLQPVANLHVVAQELDALAEDHQRACRDRRPGRSPRAPARGPSAEPRAPRRGAPDRGTTRPPDSTSASPAAAEPLGLVIGLEGAAVDDDQIEPAVAVEVGELGSPTDRVERDLAEPERRRQIEKLSWTGAAPPASASRRWKSTNRES